MTQIYLKEESTIIMNGQTIKMGRIWVGRGQGAEPVGGIDNKIEKCKQPCPFKIKAILQ